LFQVSSALNELRTFFEPSDSKDSGRAEEEY
jgi:hypothetical protein